MESRGVLVYSQRPEWLEGRSKERAEKKQSDFWPDH